MAEWDNTIAMERYEPSAAADVGNLDSRSSTKKAAKATDMCCKVGTELGGSRVPVLAKMIPLITKTYRSDADFHEASKAMDDGSFSGVAWELSSATSNMAAAVMAMAGGGQIFLTRQIEQTLMSGVHRTLLHHIAEHSTISSVLGGVWSGSPFITPWGGSELRGVLGSDLFKKSTKRLVDSSLAGVPAVGEVVSGYREMFNSVSAKAFFKTPEFPTTHVEGLINSNYNSMPGTLSDNRKLTAFNKVASKVGANVLPVASVLFDGYGTTKAWAAYNRTSDREASAEALTSVFFSATGMVGSIINAFAMNTRTSTMIKPAMKVPLLGLGLGLMVGGACGSYAVEEYVSQKTTAKKAEHK